MPKRIDIDDAVLVQLEAQCPRYLSPTGFANLLLEQALTGVGNVPAYRVGAGTPEKAVWSVPAVQAVASEQPANEGTKQPAPPTGVVSSEDGKNFEPKKKALRAREVSASRDPFARRALDRALVPDDLKDCADLIVDFWSVKKGTRSEKAATRLFERLRAMGDQEQREALATAYDAQWATVYPPKPNAPAQGKWTQPEQRHPASREFRNGRFVDEDTPSDNTVLEGLF